MKKIFFFFFFGFWFLVFGSLFFVLLVRELSRVADADDTRVLTSLTRETERFREKRSEKSR